MTYQRNSGVTNLFCTVVVIATLSGCASMSRERPVPGDPLYAPAAPQELIPPAPVNGSLYQAGQGYSLYTDKVAHRIGDILTVQLQERTQSSKTSETSLSKDSGTSFNEGSILGSALSMNNLSLGTDLEMEREFTGEAESDQSNSLTGSIAVTVAAVLPNGLLRIRGEKWLTLNQGDEYIRLTGLVRPEDISDNNIVRSDKIADARIAYGATGEFDDANRMGWGSRVFNSEWWPF
ncbi:MAG: flagellar basal body L-ring protein FlgH [Pseudomonadales bacterium]|uniref:Flagellar L-ring protein n=1 Tax=Oleiphilus messinensis TaxID=141451 RepID=A0A1Y0I9G1_9GAMM|nr:flagellar basal body L-ring protein FlgH [Oleiphilus messinensis]ARU57101.1 flagellar basal body L-ring protein [Oleiphilus messinensis]MCG8611001.1 flagellar basal body L-ring protein FlgH [Pseudomonadales bacterium]